MGKKRSRSQQTSKGITHQNPKRMGAKLQKAQRLEYRGSVQEGVNKMQAHKRFKRVMLTIPNPDASNTRERYIRVPSTEVWGSAKRS
jgi:hypothetical protein